MNDQERWDKLRRLFAEAVDLPDEERAAFLRRECHGDAELLAELTEMLESPATSGFVNLTIAPMPAGRLIGDYELIRLIGRGSFGMVYLATQRQLNRTVALKVLGGAGALDEREVQRFQREARAIARLSHPHITTVFAVGEIEGVYFLAMEYMPHGDLAKAMEQARSGTPLSIDGETFLDPQAKSFIADVVEISRQTAQAIHHAHAHGIVHRDMKPANILVSGPRSVKVADFGLALDARFGSLSRSGTVRGTPDYMSPEQARVRDTAVDHRTDVYSLGVVMYELLTGTRPFRAGTMHELFRQIAVVDPPRLRKLAPRVPADLETITHKAMDKDPTRRYPSAAALADDLERFQNHLAIHAVPPSAWDRAGQLARRHRRLLAALPAVLVLAMAGAWLVDQLATARDQRRLLAHLAQIDPGPSMPLERLSISHLLDLRETCEQLTGNATAVDWMHRLAGYRDRRLAEHGQLVLVRRDPLSGSWLRTRATAGIRELRLLFPNDPTVAAAMEQDPMPRVTLIATGLPAEALPATASYRAIDILADALGPEVRLGELPVIAAPMAPGYYRLLVVLMDGTFREFTRYLEAGGSAMEIVVGPGDRERDPFANMVAFEGGEYTFPVRTTGSHLAGHTVPLRPFLIDKYEVSNADYERFLRAHPEHPLPKFWEGPRPDHWGTLPVVGVSWLDAIAYAEWVGKRLPTVTEWTLAARGSEGRLFPWTDRPDGDMPDANINVRDPTRPNLEQVRDTIFRYAAPVDSFPDARTPEGLHNMFGNVREFTESPKIEVDLEVPTPLIWRRMLCGKDWRALSQGVTLEYYDHTGIGRSSANYDAGFRCAKSIIP